MSTFRFSMIGIVVMCAACFSAGPASADIILPNLPPGSQYQLAFVTQGTRDATSPYIADYNAFVTQQAQQNPNLPQGVMWHAIASTFENWYDMKQAFDNAPFTPSIPVYNTKGQLVANAAHPLYSASGNIINPINGDQFGQTFNGYVWTGSGLDGTWDNPLGNGNNYGPPDLGYNNALYQGYYTGWAGSMGFDTATNLHPLYALSSPITVPEPSTLILLGIGAIGLFSFFWRRGCSQVSTI